MRPVEYKTEDIIRTGLELQALSRKVSGYSLQQKLGGGNTKRLEQVWNDYLTSQAVTDAEPATELPSEIAKAVTIFAKSLTDQLLALAIEINDKAVKAAERRVEEVISSVEDQREQAEKELADAQTVIQSKTLELAKLQERFALTEQAAKTEGEQRAAELTGQLEATKTPTAKPMQIPSGQQTGIKNKEIDSQKKRVPNPNPNPDCYKYL